MLNDAPDWLNTHLAATLPDMHTNEQRMRWVIDLARENIAQQTGGPFAAAVFDINSGKLIAASVNRVESLQCSLAHAEMMALAAAERHVGHFDLSATDLDANGMACELVTSSEPCAMCFGALPWSGIRRLVCAARAVDAEKIGFDEGPKHPNWQRELERRGIAVQRDVSRDEAVAILIAYHASGGMIYNGLFMR